MANKTNVKELLRALKFTLISLSAGIIQILLFTLINEILGWTYWAAYLIALLASIVWNFTVNRRVTFKAAGNVALAMLLVLLFYAVFTPVSTVLGELCESAGANEYAVLAVTMILNFLLEYLYTRYIVYAKKCDTAEVQDEQNVNNSTHRAVLPKRSAFAALVARVVTGFVARFIFKRRFIRNELRGKRGPLVVIANHQAAYDFVNLFDATREPMHFVISESFYKTLPIRGFLDRIGVIAKQQFQTTIRDLHTMRAVIDAGRILVIYPAGLMCEDGLSTPIPEATYQFLKWLGADVYMAKTSGTYFAMPKWAHGIRSGRTYMDIFKLFTKEELAELELPAVKERTDAALLFDAYREQEELLVKYRRGANIMGLENVLYVCPHCKSENSMAVRDKSEIYCRECTYSQRSDKYGFLHKTSEVGEEIRYVSDWSRMIHESVAEDIRSGELSLLSTNVTVHMVESGKYRAVGTAEVTVDSEHIHISGTARGNELHLSIAMTNFVSLPFSPGEHFEIQHGHDSFRCYPDDPGVVMKLVNMVKVFHEINAERSAVGAR